jgi:N-succinyldiaminopimelate aminotransferase
VTPGHPVYAQMGTTIFEHMSGLARELGAINLGQGFPDDAYAADSAVTAQLQDAAVRALRDQSNQYPPSSGVPALREAVAAFYASQGLALTAAQVIVTSGATEAIAAATLALVQPGDEVILFSPAYDAYAPMVRRCGAVPMFVPLRPPAWRIDEATIRAVITPRTRAIILNDPLNPLGTVATPADLAMLAAICVEHDLIAISDEVWEGVRFDDGGHRSLMGQPGMAARTVKIGSAGKLFGLTGWKIGWMVAEAGLAALLARAHQFLTFTSPPALQWAVAEGLNLSDAVFADQHRQWARSRARLADGLRGAGYVVESNQATWFLCIDLAASGVIVDDAAFAERAVREAGVASIPISALYEGGPPPRNYLRLCFTKPDAQIDFAVAQLAIMRENIRSALA